VDDSFLAPVDHAMPSAPTLLSVGRLAEQKGQLLLIEAASLLADRGIQFHLTIVGDGEMRQQIEKLIADRRLGDRITLAGWKSNTAIRDMMLSSRALIMPSFAEGLPVVLMESLALKRPVVSTYIAGIPELVENGVCGQLVPAGDVSALADAMAAVLCATPGHLEQLGNAGRQRVLERHDASIEAGRLAALFRCATANHAPQSEPTPALPALSLPKAGYSQEPGPVGK
jgi:glycosyltransferase involved in cell wall biosynthesis